MPLADYQALTDDLVRDDTGKITTADRDEAVARAVARYSKDRPRTKVEDVAAPGGNTLNLPLVWEPGFSELRSIEYPIGEIPPALLDADSYWLYDGPAGQIIQIVNAIIAAQQVRITFTIRHRLDATNDTIRADDREPVCALAAGLLLEQLAAYFAGSSDSSIQADAVDRRSKSQEFAARANAMRKRYFDDLGIDLKRNVAAGVVVDLDAPDSLGQDRLLHPRRYR